MPRPDVARNYPVSRRAMPDPGVGCPRPTAPYAGSPPCGGFPRLACLIHAANVRSEPGSNPSRVCQRPRGGLALRECLRPPLSGVAQRTWSGRPGLPGRPAQEQSDAVQQRHPAPAGSYLTPTCQRAALCNWLEGCALVPVAVFCRRVCGGKGNNTRLCRGVNGCGCREVKKPPTPLAVAVFEVPGPGGSIRRAHW